MHFSLPYRVFCLFYHIGVDINLKSSSFPSSRHFNHDIPPVIKLVAGATGPSSLPSFRVEARHGPFGSVTRLWSFHTICQERSWDRRDRIKVGRQTNYYYSQKRALDPESTTRGEKAKPFLIFVPPSLPPSLSMQAHSSSRRLPPLSLKTATNQHPRYAHSPLYPLQINSKSLSLSPLPLRHLFLPHSLPTTYSPSCSPPSSPPHTLTEAWAC